MRAIVWFSSILAGAIIGGLFVTLGFLLVVRPEPEGEFGAIMWGVLVGMPIGGVVAIRMLKRRESRKLG